MHNVVHPWLRFFSSREKVFTMITCNEMYLGRVSTASISKSWYLMQPTCKKACAWSWGAHGRSAGRRDPWAPAAPAGSAARRLGAPGRPGRVAGTRRASEGSCRVTFPRESCRLSPLEASLPFVCFSAGGWRAAGFLLLHHAPRGPCDSPDLPGVGARTSRPVLAGVAPIPSSPAGRCAPVAEELRSPQGRAPAWVRGASKWGQGFRGFCWVTCHRGWRTGAAEGPLPGAPARGWRRGRGSWAVVSLRGHVALFLLAWKLRVAQSLEDFDGCLPFGVREGEDPRPMLSPFSGMWRTCSWNFPD